MLNVNANDRQRYTAVIRGILPMYVAENKIMV